MNIYFVERAQADDRHAQYDCNFGHVIRAEDELSARRTAGAAARDEQAWIWYDPEETSCTVIGTTGMADAENGPDIVLTDSRVS